MEFFRHTHKTLIESTHPTLKRELLNIINWDDKLICIKGFRGVGKTTFMLDHIKQEFPDDQSVLYVNLNNFYFTKRTLFSFADEFVKRGGKILFLDQIQKYPNWSEELYQCHVQLSGLKIVFTSSPMLNIEEGDPYLKDIVKINHLEGLSFREYLNYTTNNNFRFYSFAEILKNHVEISGEIIKKVRPLAYFNDYLKNGFFPYFIENPNFYNNRLLKHINLALEIDVPYLNQIELKYLAKLRKLLYIIAADAPFSPNVSKLAAAVETSRATVMNYLRYLKDAKLIYLLYSGNGDDEMNCDTNNELTWSLPDVERKSNDHKERVSSVNNENYKNKQMKKPDKVYMHNTNLLYAIAPNNAKKFNLQQTFFYNQVSYKMPVNSSEKADFLINNTYHFVVDENKTESGKDIFTATDMIEFGSRNKIPLWLFGFLY